MPNKSAEYRVSLPFELLKTFTEKELYSFEKLIVSGYISAKQGLDKLLKSLKKHALHHKNFTPLIQCSIYNQLFNNEKAKEVLNDNQKKKLSKIMNELLHVAEKFLMFEKIKDTDEHNSALLYPELIDRKQLLLYSRRMNIVERKLNKQEKRGVEYYNQCYQIQKEKARLSFINNTLPKEDNYDELQKFGDIKYLLQKLQYHLAKITLQRKYAHKNFNYKPFNALQALLNLPENQSNLLIQLYLLNIKLVNKEEEATFLALSKLLKEKQEVIPEDFLNVFYTNLNNYCIYQLSKGDLNFHNHLFKIYNDLHDAKLLVHSKNMDIGILKNIITIACQVGEYKWAKKKLAYYIRYVPSNIKQSVFEYNSGIINFNQQKYAETLNHLNKVRKIDDTHELNLRIVQLQCYYETDTVYETSTQQIIDSLKTFIHQNKKLTSRQKTAYFNFIRIFNKLYKFKSIPDKRSQKVIIKKTLPKLKTQLSQFDRIWRKPWLLIKLKVLEKSQ